MVGQFGISVSWHSSIMPVGCLIQGQSLSLRHEVYMYWWVTDDLPPHQLKAQHEERQTIDLNDGVEVVGDQAMVSTNFEID